MGITVKFSHVIFKIHLKSHVSQRTISHMNNATTTIRNNQHTNKRPAALRGCCVVGLFGGGFALPVIRRDSVMATRRPHMPKTADSTSAPAMSPCSRQVYLRLTGPWTGSLLPARPTFDPFSIQKPLLLLDRAGQFAPTDPAQPLIFTTE